MAGKPGMVQLGFGTATTCEATRVRFGFERTAEPAPTLIAVWDSCSTVGRVSGL